MTTTADRRWRFDQLFREARGTAEEQRVADRATADGFLVLTCCFCGNLHVMLGPRCGKCEAYRED